MCVFVRGLGLGLKVSSSVPKPKPEASKVQSTGFEVLELLCFLQMMYKLYRSPPP